MSDFRDHLAEELKDGEFRKEWEERRPKYEMISALIALRGAHKLSQAEVAKRAGTTQTLISQIERGTANPSIGTMDRIAKVFGRRVHISFV
ncbi:hypothetical protein AGMMS50229_00750 [Campylobacterota bacterium]|nr:hypothetical protein AGMMS50229_00750 [Campylobacterota bacterium]